MSARPRPVTATIKPPSMDPPTGVRERRYSLSSGSSTASLVSVLDHDSYESPGTDSEEERERIAELNINNSGKVTEDSETRISSTDPSKTETENQNGVKELSPWEKWLIRKVKEDRKQQQRELRKKAKEKALAEEEKKLKEEKQKAVEEKVNEWMEKKALKEQVQKKMEVRRSKTKKELEEAKKKEIEEKSTANFADWKTKKLAAEKEQKRLEKEKKKREEEEKLEKQKKCEEAFKEWCKKSANKVRPKSAHNSFGYTSGKLTGYYDGNATPVPSFYNPIPWQPIHVPNPKTERKKRQRPKTARTYRWNPNKYFN